MALINQIAVFIIPFVMLVIISYGMYKKADVYSSFIEGAEEGMKTVVKIFPVITAILVAVAMLRESGTMDIIINAAKPVTDFLHIPEEVMPLMLLRPVSGGGSLGILTDMLDKYGPDSFIGRCSSVIMGATETTLYTMMVYFSATKVKYTRATLGAALIADITGMCMGVYICSLIFNQ